MDIVETPSAIGSRILAMVREVLGGSGIVAEVGPRTPLVEAGVASVEMVALMLRLEAEFDVAFAEAEITPENFRSAEAIEELLARRPGGQRG